MSLIHHIVSGLGAPPIVFVHGFGCDHSDWNAQVAALSPRHQTVAVDLRGHGASPGPAADCSIERYGADVAEVMRALSLLPCVLVGHSMGCRVVVEAALQAPALTVGVVLVDGSQFAPAMEAVLRTSFAMPNGLATMTAWMFRDMFGPKADAATASAVIDRAGRLPRAVGEKMMTDMLRYDVGRLPSSLAGLRVPVMAVQTTYANEKRERRSLVQGQATPYLDMLRATVPSIRVEIVEGTGHFPQLEEPARTTALLESFATTLPAR